MVDELRPHQVAQGVHELAALDEQVVLGVESLPHHGALPVEGQPLLDAVHPGPRGQVGEQDEVQRDRGGQDGIAAQEIDLDLHRIAHPPEDVDVVPRLLVVAARRVVVDVDLVVEAPVQLGIEVRPQDGVEDAELGDLLGAERLRVVQDHPVAVAEDVRREPARDPQQARREPRGQDGLHQGLARLEVLARHGDALLRGQLEQRRAVRGDVRRPVDVGDPHLQRRVGVDLAGADLGRARLEPRFERLEAGVDPRGRMIGLGRRRPAHDHPVRPLPCPEVVDVLHQRLGQGPLRRPLLDVRPVEVVDERPVEDGRHGLDSLQLVPDQVDVLPGQHPGLGRRRVGGVREDVPAPEDQVVEPGQADEVLDEVEAPLGPLPQADLPRLGQRADGPGQPLARGENARQHGRTHGPDAGQEHAEPALRRGDIRSSADLCHDGSSFDRDR